MITNILLSAYLVNKAVDTYLMLGMVLLFAFVFWIVFRITRKSAKNEAETKKEEPPKYWIEKIIRGDGTEWFWIKSNKFVLHSIYAQGYKTLEEAKKAFYDLQDTLTAMKSVSQEKVFEFEEDSLANPAKDCKNQKDAGQTKPNSTVTSIKS